MSEIPSRLYEHLAGSAEEIVARLEALDLLASWTPETRAGMIVRLRARLAAVPARREGAPDSTGQTIQAVLQSELYTSLNEKGRELAGRRAF